MVFPKGAKDVQDHKIYVDGKLFGGKNSRVQLVLTGTTQEASMGARLGNHDWMHGSFDEVAVLNVGLTVE